jgi:hypothetical protein
MYNLYYIFLQKITIIKLLGDYKPSGTRLTKYLTRLLNI